MNATDRLLRWLGIREVLGFGLKPTARRRALLGWFLPTLILAGMTFAAPAQYRFGTITNEHGTLTVRKGPSCPSGALVIPDAVDGQRVTSIGNDAFLNCTDLIGVTLPDSVTRIEDRAFVGCSSLTRVTIGNSVTRIGEWAFAYAGLTNVTIGNGVTSIGESAFRGCTDLTNVTIADSVAGIGYPAFNGCSALTSVTIPDSVTSIGDEAFSDCSNLTGFDVAPLNPAYSSLDRVLFNKNFTTLVAYPGGKAGYYTIPDGITGIGGGAFGGCPRLTSITIPDGVTSIGNSAFFDCTGLTSITIPDSVTSIGRGGFYGCTGLTSVGFEGNAPRRDWVGLHETEATIHYLPGTEGWTSTFSDRPTAPWVRPNPTILDFGDRFGPSTNGFSFVISWATNVPVVVEASAEIGGSTWTPISTNTLTDGWIQFTDSEWKSQPARFYRVRGK